MHHPSRNSEANTVSGIASLPTELHLRIQREVRRAKIHHLNLTLKTFMSLQFVRDPDTTFNDLKPLRFVCKSFDTIWSPLVLSTISIFPRSADHPCDVSEHLSHLE